MFELPNNLKKAFKHKTKSAVHNFDLSLSLRHVLDMVMEEKKEMSLDEIFNMIGDRLLEENISSIISVLDDKKENLIIRHFRFNDSDLETKIKLEKNFISKKYSIKECFKYSEAIKNKKTFFSNDCPNGLLGFDFDEAEQRGLSKKRVTSPLVLRGEVIGFVDFFSMDLQKYDVKQFEKFSENLMSLVANTILLNEVRKTEEKYQDLFENAREGFFILNGRHKKMIEVNKGLSEITKYTKGELLQLNYLTLISENEKDRVNSIIRSRLNKNEAEMARKYDTEIITKDQKKKYVRITITKVISDDEWFCVMSDITKRKKAEEEVQRLSELNQSILDSVPVSIVTLDEKGRITSVNTFGKKIFSAPLELILGKRLVDYKEISQTKELVEQYEKLLKEGDSFVCDSLGYVSDKTGEKKYLSIIAVPLYDKNGKIKGAISMGVDNTETVLYKKQIENLNRDLEKKIIERTEELRIANKKLNEVLLLKTKFLSDASHELRTPLTIIQGNLDLAVREIQMEKGRVVPEVFEIINHEVDSMTRILTDLTMLSNTDDNRENLRYEKVDLIELLERISKSLEVLAQQKNIKIIIEGDLTDLKIMGDEARLEKLFLNIIRNAIKYTDQKGKIIVKMKKEQDVAVISIKDNGIGIPEKDLPFIFERFYRADKARSRAEGGTGLGLSICKWIVERHKGEIKVDSVLGEGSEFRVILPLDFMKKA